MFYFHDENQQEKVHTYGFFSGHSLLATLFYICVSYNIRVVTSRNFSEASILYWFSHPSCLWYAIRKVNELPSMKFIDWPSMDEKSSTIEWAPVTCVFISLSAKAFTVNCLITVTSAEIDAKIKRFLSILLHKYSKLIILPFAYSAENRCFSSLN